MPLPVLRYRTCIVIGAFAGVVVWLFIGFQLGWSLTLASMFMAALVGAFVGLAYRTVLHVYLLLLSRR